MVWVFVLLLSLASWVDGLDILTNTQRIRSINGLLTSETYITIQCNPSDVDQQHFFQVSDSTTTYSVVATCNGRVIRYDIYLQGYIAADGLYYSNEVCTVVSTARFVDANSTSTTTSSSSSNRVLLSETKIDPDYYRLEQRTAICNQFLSSAANPAEFNASCIKGPNRDAFDQLTNAADNATTSITAFMNQFVDIERNQSAILTGIGEFNSLYTNWTAIIGRQLNASLEEITIAGDYARQTNYVINQQNNAQLDSLRELNSEMLNSSTAMTLALNTSSTTFDRAAAALATVFTGVITQLVAYGEQVIVNKQIKYSQFRATQQAVLDQQTNFRQFYTNEQMMVEQNVNIQAQLKFFRTEPNVRGTMLYPFLPDIGSAAQETLSASDASVPGADDIFRYLVPLPDGSTVGYLTRMIYKCDTKWTVRYSPAGATFRDFMEWLGPVDCDATWVTQSPLCKCVFTVTENRCTVRASGTLLPAEITAWYDANPTDLTSVSGCLSAPATGTLDGTTVRHSSEYNQVIQTISRRGISTGTSYQHNPVFLKSSALVAYSAALSNATIFGSMSFMQQNDGNLMYFHLTSLPYSFNNMLYRLNEQRALVYGELPNGLGQKATFFNVWNGGRTGPCTRMSMVFFSNEFLTVSKYRRNSISDTVSVTVNGNATTFDLARSSNPYDYLAPVQEAFYWAPDLVHSAGWLTPRVAETIGPYHVARENRLVYTMQPDYRTWGYNNWHKVWSEENTTRFKPDAAANFASAYRVTIDSNTSSPLYGRCIGNVPNNGGRLCDMRDHYRVVAAGVFDDPVNPGTIFMSGLDDTRIGTIRIPGSQIREVVSSSCPRFRVVAGRNSRMYVRIVNPLASNNLIRIDQIGSCPKSNVVTLSPKQTIEHVTAVCPTAPLNQPDFIRLSYLNGTSGFIMCNGTATLDRVNGTQSSLFTGAVTTDTYERMKNETVNAALSYATTVKTELVGLMLKFALFAQNASATLGIGLTNETGLEYATVYQALRELTNTGDILAAVRAAQNSSAGSGELERRFAEKIALSIRLSIEERQIFAQLKLKSAALQGKAEDLHSLTLLGVNTLSQMALGLQTWIRAIYEAELTIANPCNLTSVNDTCWKTIGENIASIGDMDHAACAPSGLVSLFGGGFASSAFFAETLGLGCSAGNFLGPFLIAAALAMFAAGMIVLGSKLYDHYLSKGDPTLTAQVDAYVKRQNEQIALLRNKKKL